MKDVSALVEKMLGRRMVRPLPSSIAVGDFGQLTKGVFTTLGRLEAYGYALDVGTSAPLPRSVVRSANLRFADAQAQVDDIGALAQLAGTGNLTLDGAAGAVLVHVGSVEYELKNLGGIKADLQRIKKAAGLGHQVRIVTKVMSTVDARLLVVARSDVAVQGLFACAGLDVKAVTRGSNLNVFLAEGIVGPLAFDVQRVTFVLGTTWAGVAPPVVGLDDEPLTFEE